MFNLIQFNLIIHFQMAYLRTGAGASGAGVIQLGYVSIIVSSPFLENIHDTS